MVGGRATADRLRLAQIEVAKDRQPRRQVELTGYGVLDDGTTFGLSVLDLSYDGAKVKTDVALMPGLTLKISILGIAGALNAAVRWYKDGCAGLKFNPEDEPEVAQVPRNCERLAVSAQLWLRRTGRQQYQTRVFDIAPTGCKVEFIERPRPDEVLWVKFDGLEAVEAKVRWIDGFYGGLEFVRPIYAAVFELLIARIRP